MTSNEEGRSAAPLRADIDRGRTRDKVNVNDPAAAPLGTDEEAAGTPCRGQRGGTVYGCRLALERFQQRLSLVETTECDERRGELAVHLHPLRAPVPTALDVPPEGAHGALVVTRYADCATVTRDPRLGHMPPEMLAFLGFPNWPEHPALRMLLETPRELSPMELNGVIASVAHLAYHLGAIRQIDRSIQGPKAT